jgi:hypothetical protein
VGVHGEIHTFHRNVWKAGHEGISIRKPIPDCDRDIIASLDAGSLRTEETLKKVGHENADVFTSASLRLSRFSTRR